MFRAEERDECQAAFLTAGGIRGGGVFRSAGLRPVCDLRRGVDACRGGGGRVAFFAGAGGRSCTDDAFFEGGLLDRFDDEGVGARVDESPDVGFLRDGSVGVVLDDGGTHEGNSSDEGDEPDFMQFHGVDFGSIVYLLVKVVSYHDYSAKNIFDLQEQGTESLRTRAS